MSDIPNSLPPKPDFLPDFLLPKTEFALELLDSEISKQRRTLAATLRSHLVVLNKYFPVEEGMDQERRTALVAPKILAHCTIDAEEFERRTLEHILKNRIDAVRQELEEIVPAGVDIETELADASTRVGEEIQDVPSVNTVLYNTLSDDVKALCEQTHAGLCVMAINNEWEGNEKIQVMPSEEGDNPHLQMAKTTLSETIRMMAVDDEHDDFFSSRMAMPYGRTSGFMALIEAERGFFQTEYYPEIGKNIQAYTNSEGSLEREYTYQEAYDNFLKASKRVARIDPPSNEFKL